MLRVPAFRRLFLSRTASLLGDAIAPVALAFAVLGEGGGSATDLGLLLTARTLAEVLLLLVGGTLADRLPRFRLMAGADLLGGLAQAGLAAMFLAGAYSLGPLLALSALSGAATALFLPASTGALPLVVDAGQLQPANALVRVAQNVSMIAGAALAGLLVAVVGAGWALAVDGATFLVSALLLIGVRARPQVKAAPASALADLREGWREFVSREWVWVVVLQFAVLTTCTAAGMRVLGPLVAERDLGGAGPWSAVLTGQAVGLLAGSFLVLRVRPRFPIRVATYATFGFVLPMALLALGSPLWLLVAAAFVNGVCADVFVVLWYTALQTHVPEDRLARVSAYDALGSFALNPLGLAVVGPVTAVIGVTRALWACVGLAVLVNALALLSRSVRRLPAGAP
ncbi:MFS transporter [Motilibacter sp. E257]|uniref:MFS transporter n=1 Tax=Motilibacter deserti TaxID=2714956 RepID=A0ABX0GVQ7_9ACTN|nr:MFS transporter [Motilibacter deserti]NHC13786.1 MFS transporter [Motilibacter deserti]